MPKLLLKNGTVIDPKSKKNDVLDILIDGRKIKDIGKNIKDKDSQIISAKGKIIAPGLVDVHVHFREPGFEYKETIKTGSYAAAAGGFTTVVMEPNTSPPLDTPSRIARALEIAKNTSIINIYTKACISKGLRGNRITDVKTLVNSGAVAISDDGNPVAGKKLMHNALIESKKANSLVSPHCEESKFYRNKKKLASKEKKQSHYFTGTARFADKPYCSEADFIKRDIELAKKTRARLHISHVSLAESVELIANAKNNGVNITAEAAPHHLLLTEKDEEKIGTNAKVNPPLRTQKDVEAVREGLIDGTIDIIASDHAPHTILEKALIWEKAPFGLIGLETTLALVLTHLVKPGLLTMSQAIKKMSILPAKIFRLKAGSLALGSKADIIIIDPKKKWTISSSKFYSKGRNCPFDEWEVEGKAVMTIVKGKIVMKDNEIIV